MLAWKYVSHVKQLTKDRYKVFNVVRQVDRNLAIASLLPILSEYVDLLAELLQIVLLDLFLAENAHNRTLRCLFPILPSLAAAQDLSPDVPQITVLAGLPSWLARLLDVQTTFQRIAVRDLGTTVDCRLVLISDRCRRGLSRKQERVSVRLTRIDDWVSEEGNDGRSDESSVEVPVREGRCDLLIERLEEDGHPDRDLEPERCVVVITWTGE